MTEVSVLGLGAMGSALARALLASGRSVTVWNRSPEKADVLGAAGAAVAASAAQAVAESPVSVVCIKTHADTAALLEPLGGALSGKTIVDLSTGDADQARKLVAMLDGNGADYMIGIINAYPSGVGKEETTIIAVSEEETWAKHGAVIRALGGASVHVGTDPGALAALFAALFTTRQGFMFGMIYGALVCRAANVPLQAFSDLIPVTMKVLPAYHKVFAETVPEGRFENPEASMATYAAALEDALKTFETSGAPAEMPRLFYEITQKAVDAGHADRQLTALTELMKQS